MELGARVAEVPYLGVTGTNGKTTTTSMIETCLRADGVDAVACGNIGHPFPEAAREGHEVLVVECSSFQLRMQESFHPRVSVLLNLAPDHLDEHGSFEAYAEIKARIYAGQGPEDTHVGNREDPRRPRARLRPHATSCGSERERRPPARWATTAMRSSRASRGDRASRSHRRDGRDARRRRGGGRGCARVRRLRRRCAPRTRRLRSGAASRSGLGRRRRRGVHRRFQGHERARRSPRSMASTTSS